MFKRPTDTSLLEQTTWWDFLDTPHNLRPGLGELEPLRNSMLNYVWSLGFLSSFAPPVRAFENGVNVIDENALGVGSKARFGELLVKCTEEDELVYVQPRHGWAGISLVALAKMYGKKLTLFMPASAQASETQRLVIELGAEPRFIRVAAMPVLNKYAREYAVKARAAFIPLGLKHPLVTACAVAEIYGCFMDERPGDMWCAMSTGVLSRALQIALMPTGWQIHSVAVARNMHDGEIGRSTFMSYDRAFNQNARLLPRTFDSASNYDAKAFELAVKHRSLCRKTWFWNVAGNPPKPNLTAAAVDSDRPWGDLRDFFKP